MGRCFFKRNLLIQEQSAKSSWPFRSYWIIHFSQTISNNCMSNWKWPGYITLSQNRPKNIPEIFYSTQAFIVLGLWTLAVINFAYLNNNWLRHTILSQLPLSDQYAWLKPWNHSNLSKNALFFFLWHAVTFLHSNPGRAVNAGVKTIHFLREAHYHKFSFPLPMPSRLLHIRSFWRCCHCTAQAKLPDGIAADTGPTTWICLHLCLMLWRLKSGKQTLSSSSSPSTFPKLRQGDIDP